MSKNYILEPVEITFVDTPLDEFHTARIASNLELDVDFVGYDFSNKDLKISVDDAVFRIFGLIEGAVAFTEDGTLPELSTIYDASILIGPMGLVAFYDLPEGSHTVSIYTGEDDEPSNGLPDMNITYEYKNTAQNDIEEIIQAIYSRMEVAEEPTNGHSPLDRLVVAVAYLLEINDPEDALTKGNYPNQMKRIAAIIRGDFSEEDDSIIA